MDQELYNLVVEVKNDLGTYAAIARKFGGSRTLYWKIVKGIIKESPTARHHLGLNPKMVNVAPCRCGGVHTLKTCPQSRNRKKKFTVSFKFDDPLVADQFRDIIGPNRNEWVLSLIAHYEDRYY